jgi:hypothetical protein
MGNQRKTLGYSVYRPTFEQIKLQAYSLEPTGLLVILLVGLLARMLAPRGVFFFNQFVDL